MKQFMITLVAVLVGGFLALLAYDRWVVAPRRPEGMQRADAEPSRARNATTAVDVEAVPSVPRVDEPAARTPKDIVVGDAKRRALIVDAVQRATMFRVALTEFHQSNGRWPLDADEAGLPPPEDMRGGAVRSVVLGGQGVVTVALGAPFANDSAIMLKPELRDADAIEWVCEVRGDDDIKRALPRCKG